MAVSGLAWPPDDFQELAAFPRGELPAGTKLFRVHRTDRHPWWFASVPTNEGAGGRFDLPHPNGACYTSTSAEAALLETIRRRRVTVVPVEELERRQLTIAATPRALVPANAAAKGASAFGVSGEIHTTMDYVKTRAWAHGFYQAGFPALLSIPRHDPEQALRSVTLFDRAGEHEPFGWSWSTGLRRLDVEVIALLRPWGVKVTSIPRDLPPVKPSPPRRQR